MRKKCASWKRLKTIEYRLIDVEEFKNKPYVSSPTAVYSTFRHLFSQQIKEMFYVFLLNSANNCIGYEKLGEGILNSALVHPRETYRYALIAPCASIILAHNHPSGNGEPSAEDISITRQMTEAGKIINIPLQDHIIFTEYGYTSFAEKGLL